MSTETNWKHKGDYGCDYLSLQLFKYKDAILMATTLANDILQCSFVNESISILIKNTLNFVHMGSIYKNSSLVQVMTWYCTGNKPLPGPIMVQFHDAYELKG